MVIAWVMVVGDRVTDKDRLSGEVRFSEGYFFLIGIVGEQTAR